MRYKVKKLKCKDENLKSEILPLLKDKIFHFTSHKACHGILEDDKIKSNINNEFKYTYSVSNNSYGVKKGYVCLYDLRNKSDEVIDDALTRLYFLRPNNWDKVIYFILSSEYHSDIIDISQVKKDEKKDKKYYMWIPEVECWYPSDISLGNISEIIEVNIINRKPKEGPYESLAEALTNSDLIHSEKNC